MKWCVLANTVFKEAEARGSQIQHSETLFPNPLNQTHTETPKPNQTKQPWSELEVSKCQESQEHPSIRPRVQLHYLYEVMGHMALGNRYLSCPSSGGRK